ncbi:MAG TPA: molybdopterin cofactor-binding domain-containing protein [Verrucomicrobiae bacterium]|nr:molybdopterin cofactor-binding domain-containing protein [Verrucomicrobiae bacterium]
MSDSLVNGAPVEPERYELAAEQSYRFALGELARRDFFRVLGGGILVVLMVRDAVAQQESGGARRGQRGGTATAQIGAWLHIAGDGGVTTYTGKVEVGQDIRTSLTQAVAEELHAPASSIKLVMGDTDLTPYDMGTFGSRTTPHMNLQLRKAAAAARQTLLDLAAEKLKVQRNSLAAAGGKIIHQPTKRSLSYGELSQDRMLLKAIGETPLKPAGEWQVAGTTLKKVAGRTSSPAGIATHRT